MTGLLRLLLLAVGLLLATRAAAHSHVIQLEIDGAITPPVAAYVQQGIDRANKERALMIVLRLDTPGGLDSSMRGIIRSILSSKVPVASFVSPRGARAASAGTYILYASHIAAMEEATTLGAASPVAVGSSGDSRDPNQTTMMRKQTEDAVAYIRSLANLRGRNADWAERAVRESVSLQASDAVRMKVVDLQAHSVPDLLRQVNGRTIMVAGEARTVQVTDANISLVPPDWRTRFLSVLANPNIAFLLISLGMLALWVELTNPGLIVPGVVGVLSLLLGFFALDMLPVNYAGMGVLLLGLALIVAEVFLPSGALGLAGLVALALGGLILFEDVPGPLSLSLWVLLPVTLLLAAASWFLVVRAMHSARRPVVSGAEAMVGEEGIVLSVDGAHVWVEVLGERWQAQSTQPLRPGQPVRVRGLRHLLLQVEPIDTEILQGEIHDL